MGDDTPRCNCKMTGEGMYERIPSGNCPVHGGG